MMAWRDMERRRRRALFCYYPALPTLIDSRAPREEFKRACFAFLFVLLAPTIITLLYLYRAPAADFGCGSLIFDVMHVYERRDEFTPTAGICSIWLLMASTALRHGRCTPPRALISFLWHVHNFVIKQMIDFE